MGCLCSGCVEGTDPCNPAIDALVAKGAVYLAHRVRHLETKNEDLWREAGQLQEERDQARYEASEAVRLIRHAIKTAAAGGTEWADLAGPVGQNPDLRNALHYLSLLAK